MQRIEGAALAAEMHRASQKFIRTPRKFYAMAFRFASSLCRQTRSPHRRVARRNSRRSFALAQEAAIIAERDDISEELARLRSHVEQFGKLLAGAAAKPAKNSIFFCRKCSAKPTLCSPKLRASKPRAWRSPVSRSKSNPISRSCGSRRRTSNDSRAATATYGLHRFRPSGSGKSTLVQKLLEAARHDVFRFVHHAAPAPHGKPRKMV